jgi:transaldolase
MTTKNSTLTALNAVGQSIWYDNLSKDVLRSGVLKSFIDQGVSGLTSNPSIFKKAIADSADYDAEIKAAPRSETDDALLERLMVADVGTAADLLLPTYESSNTLDGYASIEVSPLLAHDVQGTVDSAKRLWKSLGRKNVMIKIPATKEGVVAIEKVLAEGINVNVTLIFSVEMYNQVFESYLRALETRAQRGLPLSAIASVASFFVSRVDSLVEKKLSAKAELSSALKDSFFGKVGIANCKLAYESFERYAKSPRWKALADQGAQIQRPLWASTSTKSPKLAPTFYVEALAGALTVNTVPHATLEATIKGATILPSVGTGYGEARSLIRGLEEAGVSLNEVLSELQTDGVKLFAESFNELFAAVKTKRG